MNQTRKMWVSAGVVGVIVVGGVSIAAAASAGRLEKVNQEARVMMVDKTPPSPAQPEKSPEQTPAPEDFVVSRDVNPDPDKVIEYWTEDRITGAVPMPMPEGDRLQLPETEE